jgi:hypothetical protein
MYSIYYILDSGFSTDSLEQLSVACVLMKILQKVALMSLRHPPSLILETISFID